MLLHDYPDIKREAKAATDAVKHENTKAMWELQERFRELQRIEA